MLTLKVDAVTGPETLLRGVSCRGDTEPRAGPGVLVSLRIVWACWAGLVASVLHIAVLFCHFLCD